MNILYIILTYERPKVAGLCINTLLNNSSIKPTEIFINDDGSCESMQNGLLSFCSQNKNIVPITLHLSNKNQGVGVAFETVYDTIKKKNPDIAVIVESDYIWRKDWLKDVLDVFESSPYTIGIPGTSHPDVIDREKTHKFYPSLMIEQFGEDVKAREFMYKPFDLNTKNGIIKVQGASNSCGCQIIHWKRINEFILSDSEYLKTWNYWIDRATFKNDKSPFGRHKASDAFMTSTPTYLWEKWAIKNNIDISKNFAWLDIFDYSISSHRCAGGINGHVNGLQEGDTFLYSNGWKNEYLEKNPRELVSIPL